MKQYGDAMPPPPFERDTMSMVENDVREKIVELFPDFYFHAKIVEKEIHISSLFFKKYATAMHFLPCMFSVKESYFYDLYIDNVQSEEFLLKQMWIRHMVMDMY